MTIQLGQAAPDFEQDSSQGRIRFHNWLGESWGVLFSHPRDYTPVCTTVQLTDSHKVATPVNWQPGNHAIIAAVMSDEDAKARFPQGREAQTPYLRYVELSGKA